MVPQTDEADIWSRHFRCKSNAPADLVVFCTINHCFVHGFVSSAQNAPCL